MFCRYCGKEIRENLNYCTQCGKQLRNHEPILRKKQEALETKSEQEIVHIVSQEKSQKKKTAGRAKTGGRTKTAIIVVILLTVIIAGGILLGTSLKKGLSDSNETASSANWDSVKESGKIRIAVTTDSAYKTQIASAIAEKLGLEAEIIKIDYEDRYTCVSKGTVDCSLTGESKLQDIDFSDVIYKIPLSIVVKKKNVSWYQEPSKLMDLLSDKTFALEEQSKGISAFETQKAWQKTEYTVVSSREKALTMVSKGKADATIIPTSKNVDKYENLKKIDGLLTYNLGFGIEKGSDLQEHLNDAIKELEQDGTLDQIAKENQLF